MTDRPGTHLTTIIAAIIVIEFAIVLLMFGAGR